MTKLGVGLVIGFSLILGIQCSDLKENLPPFGGALTVHKSGWTNPTSSNFHGQAIRKANWDIKQCQHCHGSRYDGGIANVSCLTCHGKSAGPEHCTTCHGGDDNAAPPRDIAHNTLRSYRGVGAHQNHFLGAGSLSSTDVPCSQCHILPSAVSSPGHIDSSLHAEVNLSGWLTNLVTNEITTNDHDSGFSVITPNPLYDSGTLTCSNTYCHGNFKNGNSSFAPIWNDTTGSQTACGTCHGDVTKLTLAQRALPKTVLQGGTHPDSTMCSDCHAEVIDGNLRIIDKSKHINGFLNIDGEERDF